jgi:hypothetical protein
MDVVAFSSFIVLGIVLYEEAHFLAAGGRLRGRTDGGTGGRAVACGEGAKRAF